MKPLGDPFDYVEYFVQETMLALINRGINLTPDVVLETIKDGITRARQLKSGTVYIRIDREKRREVFVLWESLKHGDMRMIEIYKYQFQDLNSVISQIKDRNYRFIIYMDDLSFEDFEIEYKYLKAVIEGGLEKKPSNVLIYATSNRRHLVRENSSDNADKGEDMHTGDTVQEKLSLSERFGVRIYFGSPDKREYDDIVCSLAQRCHLGIPEDELLKGAGSWEIRHGGRSGRTAQQYIDYLMGKGQGAV